VPHVLTLKTLGMNIAPLESKDILEYVDLYMGYDARNFIAEIIDEADFAKQVAKEQVESDLDDYKNSLDSNRSAFQEILHQVSIIETLLLKTRTDKQKISKIINDIEKIISNQI